jgi:hypothetical protein
VIRFPHPHPQLALALIGALHFVAVPCAMAMTVADAPAPCEHCPSDGDAMPCLITAVDPAAVDAAPAPGRSRPAVASVTELMLPPPVAELLIGLQPANPAHRIALATGRHTGDPPLTVLYQNFRN